MLSFPNAKINLGLHIIEKRTDGFHEIETVFYPVSLHDALEIHVAGQETFFRQYGPVLPEGENIVMKAYRLLAENFDLQAVDIHLLKGIPAGAGLGGGSSDAAHALVMLNDLFGLNISSAALENYAARLGSDCPFFIRNRPCLASGRGEVMDDIDLDLSAYRIEVKHPGIHVSTAEAYAMACPEGSRVPLREIIHRPVNEWHSMLANDFEGRVFKKHPAIRKLKEKMYDEGAVYASMSGSGSAVYGIFPKTT